MQRASVFLTLTTLCAAGCTNIQVEKLPNYSAAMELGGPDVSRVYDGTSVEGSRLPTAIPYAWATATVGGGASRDTLGRVAAKKLVPMKPDFIQIGDNTVAQVATIHSFSGGMGISTPGVVTTVAAVAYRRTPARMGLNFDEGGMVIVISSDSLRGAGLQEGDTILSVNGVPLPRRESDMLAFQARQLAMRPGDPLDLVWIRPGEGRMEGSAVAIENPAVHLDYPSTFSLDRPKSDGDAD